MDGITDSLGKLGLAILVGGLIGAEREFRDKSAGFRTMILICVGACVFTLASLDMGGPAMRDPARIAAQIVTGVGFLGAGVILREGGRVMGITTASTIWLTAAIGMGIGGGFYGVSLCAAGAVLVVLWLFPMVEGIIDVRADVRVYRVVAPLEPDPWSDVEATLRAAGLRVLAARRHKNSAGLVMLFEVVGRPQMHARAALELTKQPYVLELSH